MQHWYFCAHSNLFCSQVLSHGHTSVRNWRQVWHFRTTSWIMSYMPPYRSHNTKRNNNAGFQAITGLQNGMETIDFTHCTIPMLFSIYLWFGSIALCACVWLWKREQFRIFTNSPASIKANFLQHVACYSFCPIQSLKELHDLLIELRFVVSLLSLLSTVSVVQCDTFASQLRSILFNHIIHCLMICGSSSIPQSSSAPLSHIQCRSSLQSSFGSITSVMYKLPSI